MSNTNKNTKRQKCEIYTRCVGYYRPVEQFNAGKQAEYADRQTFSAQTSC